MKQPKWIGACCLNVVLSMAGSVAWTAQQDQQQKLPSSAEYNS